MEVRFISHGGIITSLKVPDRNGVMDDVVLGYDTPADYAADTMYVGALIGRCANRIANGRFTLDGQPYVLLRNDPPNHLHGGHHGFHTVTWDVDPFDGAGQCGATLTTRAPTATRAIPAR